MEQTDQPTSTSQVWTVPYSLNPFFTGRSKVLNDLHEALKEWHLVVLNDTPGPVGMQGIGKTQTAVCYAHRFRDHYGSVLWLRADHPATLVEDLAALMPRLGLKPSGDSRWEDRVSAVRHWLESHTGWLLILDNVDKSEGVKALLPSGSTGHVMVLSHRQAPPALGVSRSVSLGPLPQEEAVRFLFKRTNRVDTDTIERKAAVDLAAFLGTLPQALELAGAFLETTKMRFREYLHTLKDRARAKTRQEATKEGVWLPVLLSLEEVQKVSPGAADVLYVGVLLSREVVSLDLLLHAGEDLGPVFSPGLREASPLSKSLDTFLEPLARFGLIRRVQDPPGLAIHSSIRGAVRAHMSKDDAEALIERIQRVLECASVHEPGSPLAPLRLLPWVPVAAELAKDGHMMSLDQGKLLQRFAILLEPLGGFFVTEPLLKGALTALEAALGPSTLDAATLAHELGRHYASKNKWAQADQYFTRSLAARQQALGSSHADVAAYLHDLGRRYDEQGRHLQADHYFLRSQTARESRLGKRHPDVANYLHILGCRYVELARLEEADDCFQRALLIREKVYGTNHPLVAAYVHELACRLTELGRYQEAAPLFERAVTIARSELRLGHPDLSLYLHSLGRFHHMTNKVGEAEVLYKQALVATEQQPRPELAATLNDLGSLYHQRGKYAKAEPILQQALALARKALPPDHPNLAICLNNLGALFFARRKYAQAEPLYHQALSIRRKHLPLDHPDLLTTLENYALLLRKLKRAKEAEILESHASEIRARTTPLASSA